MTAIEQEVARGSAIVDAPVVSWTGNARSSRDDTLAVEEPLEIRLAGCSVAVTMRTPGDDLDLAAGFLYTEGIIRDAGDIASISYCPADDGSPISNIVNVNPSDPLLVDPDRWRRNFFATSSCGLCGKASIDSIRQEAAPLTSTARVATDILYTLDRRLREAQAVFSRTGGLHAAGLFDLDGTLVTLREDVGRHNAVDKVIGDAVRRRCVPLSDSVLMVSGRASFEIMQKALMAGIPIVAAVSAPSSLAVDLARASNMTLLGFLRSAGAGGGRFNVYASGERIEHRSSERGG
ncbi:MAG TPA: formate dehydrogenase accessory sulfurtransferase FdhD [Chloroflexota bacterium]